MEETDKTLCAFGTALRQEREERKLTIVAVSAKTNIPAATLAAYEAGTQEVSLLEIFRLAEALGVTAQSLFVKAGM